MTASSTDVQDLLRRMFDALSACDEAALAEVIHPDATNREAVREPLACRGRGPAAFVATARWLATAHSGLRWEVREVVQEGDLVVAHTTMSGRQTGPFHVHTADGAIETVFPATGRAFAAPQTHWLRLVDGMVVEHWANRDDMGMAKQLGWVPPGPVYLAKMVLATRRARAAA
ncbi:ester cyclase [Pseudonocardia sulfidoxydans]|nr:ester cyclase [Pseudonocardia sulfidoxydans]